MYWRLRAMATGWVIFKAFLVIYDILLRHIHDN